VLIVNCVCEIIECKTRDDSKHEDVKLNEVHRAHFVIDFTHFRVTLSLAKWVFI